jgi:hypothetical protein
MIACACACDLACVACVCVCVVLVSTKKIRWPLIKTAELEELNRRESGAVPASGTGLASPSVFNLIRHTRSYDTRHDDRRQRFDGALLQASSSQNLNVAPANTCAATTDEISGKWNVREGVPDEGKELREYT